MGIEISSATSAEKKEASDTSHAPAKTTWGRAFFRFIGGESLVNLVRKIIAYIRCCWTRKWPEPKKVPLTTGEGPTLIKEKTSSGVGGEIIKKTGGGVEPVQGLGVSTPLTSGDSLVKSVEDKPVLIEEIPQAANSSAQKETTPIDTQEQDPGVISVTEKQVLVKTEMHILPKPAESNVPLAPQQKHENILEENPEDQNPSSTDKKNKGVKFKDKSQENVETVVNTRKKAARRKEAKLDEIKKNVDKVKING